MSDLVSIPATVTSVSCNNCSISEITSSDALKLWERDLSLLGNSELVAIRWEYDDRVSGSLPKWVRTLDFLEKLVLDFTLIDIFRLGDFPGSLKELNAIGVGVVGKNKLKLEEGCFLGLEKLEILNLETCELVDNDFTVGMFRDLGVLKELRLHHNRNITELPAGVFDGLVNLETLDLRWTGVKVFGVGLFANLGSLSEFLFGYDGSPNALERIEKGAFEGEQETRFVIQLSPQHPNVRRSPYPPRFLNLLQVFAICQP